ncbi:hypothetical protein F0562_034422 [Nyssa sinensis]|uniref:Remorin C-terminal domain-containing protein n=1 Tax=Nyssa sinensis TaxID=561372 RepID=A0A5J5AIC1_9ASTE|nr:hypothetical protein F0562_034422 [Nyssa sinensis]
MQEEWKELEAAAAQKLASSVEAARAEAQKETEREIMDEVNKMGGEFMDHSKWHSRPKSSSQQLEILTSNTCNKKGHKSSNPKKWKDLKSESIIPQSRVQK